MSGPLGFVLDLLFPPKCVFCGKVLDSGESGFCRRCQRELPWLTDGEAELTGEFFSLCAAPLRYQDKVRDSIHRYKFKGRRGYHKVYGKLVAQCVHDHLDGRYDLITWVPLSDRRKRERGYDQAFLLASAAALELGDVAVETLRKERNTDPQSGITEDAQRRANVLGVYEPADPERISGRRILLVDDICTTGATLGECVRVLREAGAADVVCAAAALTPLRREKSPASGEKA